MVARKKRNESSPNCSLELGIRKKTKSPNKKQEELQKLSEEISQEIKSKKGKLASVVVNNNLIWRRSLMYVTKTPNPERALIYKRKHSESIQRIK